MNPRRHLLVLSLTAALVWTFAATDAQAAVTSVAASNVDAYFGSLSDANQVSNPIGLNPWPFVGIGPFPGATFLPGVPAFPLPTVTPSNVTPFAPAASTSSFSDGFGNIAISKILGFAAGGPTVDDAQIALSMFLTQTGSTYAYEQLNSTSTTPSPTPSTAMAPSAEPFPPPSRAASPSPAPSVPMSSLAVR